LLLLLLLLMLLSCVALVAAAALALVAAVTCKLVCLLQCGRIRHGLHVSHTPIAIAIPNSNSNPFSFLLPFPFPFLFSIPIPYPGACSSLVLDWCCFTLVFSPCSTYTTLFTVFQSTHSLAFCLCKYAIS